MLVAALVNIIVVAAAGYLRNVPNPDAVFYLTAAEHFAKGQWREGVAVYGWPFYSLQIAAVMVLTGFHAFPAAIAVNAAYTAALAAVFVYLIGLLSGRDTIALLFGVLVIAFNDRLAAWAPIVVRDHGYWFFLLATVATVVAHHKAPSLSKKLLLLVEIGLASLFRVEGAYLFLVVPGFIAWTRLRSPVGRAAVLAVVALASLAGVAGFSLWTSDGFQMLHDLGAPIAHRISVLEKVLIKPDYARGNAWYIGMVVATIVAAFLRAMTNQLSVMLVVAFYPKRVMSSLTSTVFFWFTLGQLPALVIFTTLQLFLPWRYMMGIALVASIAIVFLLRSGYGEWREGRMRAYLLMPIAIIAIMVGWVTSLPAPTHLAYLRDAGLWIRSNAGPNEYVWIGEPRILYYSGRTEGLAASTPFGKRKRRLDAPNSYFAIARAPSRPLPAWLQSMQGRRLIKRFVGKDGNAAEIYVRCPHKPYC
jgi:hypothetical protein